MIYIPIGFSNVVCAFFYPPPKNISKRSITFVFIILAFNLSQCSVANAKVVTINIITEDSVILQYKEKGKIVGPATDIVTDTIEQAGFSYDIKMLPWSRAYKVALTQKNTLIYSLARTADCEDKFHWTR